MTLINSHRPTGQKPAEHLLEAELAARWRLSQRTLQRWRGSGQGPGFLLIGKRVLYRLTDIEAFEAAARHIEGGGK
ncbi:helix-turn-helix transcriptional regulator [Mesorhizobium sangaii]|uniref:Helix-turn-helix domain-containing protein n=1 Tax=Mesorhizobium sangaii TaxID=505389 RepID=A0A841PP53_9HYPH|nr:helix-turn-helix domain-containing protein [Mesorhizobium sangaii]MBB6411932.1 hypothetical protein [Mesorhizobium sangaii]